MRLILGDLRVAHDLGWLRRLKHEHQSGQGHEPKARRGEQPTPPRAVLLHHGVDQDRQRAVRDVAVHRRRHSSDSFGLPRRAFCREHRTYEAIPPARQGFDKTGIVRAVTERFAQFVDGFVESVLEVDEGVGGPEPVLQLFAGDHLAWPFKEYRQHFKRLAVELDL